MVVIAIMWSVALDRREELRMSEFLQRVAQCVYQSAHQAKYAVFAGLIGASLAFVTPTSAKFIGTMYYEPEVMLEMCKSDIERGEAGFCTGYVIATLDQTARAGDACLTPGADYEDMVSAVVRQLKYVLAQQFPKNLLDTRAQTEAALRLTWPYKNK
jgi:hypothetical protein